MTTHVLLAAAFLSASAAPSNSLAKLLPRSTDQSTTNSSLSPKIWVIILYLFIILLMLYDFYIGACPRYRPHHLCPYNMACLQTRVASRHARWPCHTRGFHCHLEDEPKSSYRAHR